MGGGGGRNGTTNSTRIGRRINSNMNSLNRVVD